MPGRGQNCTSKSWAGSCWTSLRPSCWTEAGEPPDLELLESLARLARAEPDSKFRQAIDWSAVWTTLRPWLVGSGVGISGLVLLVLYTRKIQRRYGYRWSPSPRSVYISALDHLGENGVRRGFGEIQRKFADRVQEQFPAFQQVTWAQIHFALGEDPSISMDPLVSARQLNVNSAAGAVVAQSSWISQSHFTALVSLDRGDGMSSSEYIQITSLEEVMKVVHLLRSRLRASVVGRNEVIDLNIVALLADGHVLLEDYPGSGKTTLAKALGDCLIVDQQSSYPATRRVQFTPDLMPSDVTGTTIFDPESRSFDFRPGPLFTHVLLADEINRTSPKVQSALLEAMAEKQCTIDNQTHPLSELFFVIATQNPLDLAGTFPLPNAQLIDSCSKSGWSILPRKTSCRCC